ncbi:MAG TPA: dihydropteroate synthase [Psychromonas hadalis]|nr:dihydropteroate synthase [Psychromonas hadalis]
MKLYSQGKTLDLNSPKIMGILNVTPDSFSDGGCFNHIDLAFEHAQKMVAQGAAILDIGGESTRPGAADVEIQQELDRVIPVIEKISKNIDCWISIDTSKAVVMQEAVNAGAHIINDVRALQEKNSLTVAAKLNVPVCLMHMKGAPRTMQTAPHYENVIAEVKQFLLSRADVCIEVGISKENIILDLGFGFGKSLEHNFELLGSTKQFVDLKFPILTGVSRKSMFGQWLNRDINNRLAGSIAGAMIAMQQGSQIIRVHDVAETCDVMNVLQKTGQIE